MIISASRRTDIPCWYSEWMLNRLKAGCVYTRNPMNYHQVSKLVLSPETVDCIVFWTKDAQPMEDKLSQIDALGYSYYFQFTITPYGTALEPGLREKQDIEDTLIRLSRRIGRHRVLWRYDPIIFDETMTVDWHRRQFSRMCRKLSPYASRVTISYVDLYAKRKKAAIRPAFSEEMASLSEHIGREAAACGIAAAICCESADVSPCGIQRASCIDPVAVEVACGVPVKVAKDRNQRPGCGCCESVDIGVYNTCGNGCAYCYANRSDAGAEVACRTHRADSELLTGTLTAEDSIVLRRAESCKVKQLSFF